MFLILLIVSLIAFIEFNFCVLISESTSDAKGDLFPNIEVKSFPKNELDVLLGLVGVAFVVLGVGLGSFVLFEELGVLGARYPLSTVGASVLFKGVDSVKFKFSSTGSGVVGVTTVTSVGSENVGEGVVETVGTTGVLLLTVLPLFPVLPVLTTFPLIPLNPFRHL